MSDDIKDRLKRTVDYVRDCYIRADRGEVMDLTGLDKTVTQMCDEISELPREESESLKENMAKLLENLDMLAQNIEKNKQE